jgi:hypothetical protein
MYTHAGINYATQKGKNRTLIMRPLALMMTLSCVRSTKTKVIKLN